MDDEGGAQGGWWGSLGPLPHGGGLHVAISIAILVSGGRVVSLDQVDEQYAAAPAPAHN